VDNYSRGLFLDMHGHGHTIQRIELGYLLSRSELQMSDSILNTDEFTDESSIRTLASDNIQSRKHSELVRGETSMGTLLVEKGFPAVPSADDPFPQGTESYFSGGYNTVRHGSRDNQGNIDAIQIEMNQYIRFNDSTRLVLIDSLARVALEYYDLHYNDDFEEDYCNVISSTTDGHSEDFSIQIYPNPAENYFIVKSDLEILEVHIYNAIGQKVMISKLSMDERVDIFTLEAGMYIVQFLVDAGLMEGKMLLVN